MHSTQARETFCSPVRAISTSLEATVEPGAVPLSVDTNSSSMRVTPVAPRVAGRSQVAHIWL